MAAKALSRRTSVLSTVLGLTVALPVAVGATPASAQSHYEITKTHSGTFARGGQGVYIITVKNTGDETLPAGTAVRDTLPAGLTAVQAEGGPLGGTGNPVSCFLLDGGATVDCGGSQQEPGQGFQIFVTVAVAADAPCSVTNVARLYVGGSPAGSASDPTAITGGDCGSGGGGGGSILPISLSGIFPVYDNISLNNNVKSPKAVNKTIQGLRVDGS
ncbi:hypothetical protein [Streptomyces sp. AF1A]|jgi:uncharacterized repeat protein (TIGR01451 family)|uniref:hypothetical protein n=1 Tax=Streptomyces sp. AF1A TaxID=3394350 RepID=UPI0039BD801A